MEAFLHMPWALDSSIASIENIKKYEIGAQWWYYPNLDLVASLILCSSLMLMRTLGIKL